MKYDNTPTVVCVLVPSPIDGHLVVIRRNNEPGLGLLGLPGGYQMRGETWRQAAVREVREETGYVIEEAGLSLWAWDTDEYGNNLAIVTAYPPVGEVEERDSEQEVQAVLHIASVGGDDLWAFPRHYEAALQYYALG